MRRRTWIWTHLRESSKSSVRGRESAAVRLTRDGEKQASLSCFSLHTRARLNNNPLNTGAGAERLVVPTGWNRDAARDGGAARQLGRGVGGGVGSRPRWRLLFSFLGCRGLASLGRGHGRSLNKHNRPMWLTKKRE